MQWRTVAMVGVVLGSSAVLAGVDAAAVRFALSLPVPIQHVVIVPTGEPVSAKSARTVELSQSIELPTGQSVDVWVVPKVGQPVRALSKYRPAPVKEPAGKSLVVNLDDHLAALRVMGSDLPRPSKIVLAPAFDRGPDNPGHQPIQAVPDYANPLLVPAGQYSLWVVPANGARATLIENNLRLLAGRLTTLD
jgi:hypothetical protein